MSDEIMNNENGEETAALFVSSQKKKQAEEEARKKAEAEQAKRDAAEAEVRRMEAEVEERRRKAEEEKQALEEAAKQAEVEKANVVDKLKSSVDVEEIRSKVKEKTEGKPKLPIFIGAGVAAVVIIALILVFALKGKGGKIDFETLEFAKEYTVAEENYGVTVIYPESLYSALTEEKQEDDSVGLIAEAAGKKIPEMKIYVSEGLSSSDAVLAPAGELQKQLEDFTKASTASLKTSEEKGADVTAQGPGKYYYDCVGTTESGKSCAVGSWLEYDGNGKIHDVMCMFIENGSDPSNVIKLRDLFEEKNSDDAFKIPGANPPASTDTDGMLEIDEMHMGIIVPKDQFKRIEGDSSNMAVWTDNNGAVYSILYKEVDFDFDTAHEHAAEVQEMMNPLIEAAAGLKGMPGLESRMLMSDSWVSDLKYNGEYKDMVGGVTFWEGNYASMWRDVRTQKYYLYDLVLLAPAANEDVYKGLFEKGIDRLQDI